jgi:hypothetical protein
LTSGTFRSFHEWRSRGHRRGVGRDLAHEAQVQIAGPGSTSVHKIISWDAACHCAEAARMWCESRGHGAYVANTNALEGLRMLPSAVTLSGTWVVIAYD